MAIGKTAPNGTLNADGAFYSVQDVNVLLKNAGGGGGGADLPTPTVADAGSVVVVDNEGKYALGEAGGGDLPTPTIADVGKAVVVGDDGKYTLGGALIVEITEEETYYEMNKSYTDISSAISKGTNIIFKRFISDGNMNLYYTLNMVANAEGVFGVAIAGGVDNVGVYMYTASSSDALLRTSGK